MAPGGRSMTNRTKHRMRGGMVLVAALAFATALAAPAGAAFPKGDPVYKFKYRVLATTYVKKANLTLSPPPGVFAGGIDLATGELQGGILIPNTTFTQTEAGIGLVTATAAILPTKPVTGHVNIGTFKVTATSTFNIHIISMYPALLTLPTLPPLPPPLPPLPPLPSLPKVNLVGNACGTSSPISVTMSGKASLDSASTFKGTFTIPTFSNCGVMTEVINQEIPGPGNTFTATATPPPS